LTFYSGDNSRVFSNFGSYANNGSWIDLELVVVNQGREFRTVVSSLYQGGNAVPANIGSTGTRVDNVDGDAPTAAR